MQALKPTCIYLLCVLGSHHLIFFSCLIYLIGEREVAQLLLPLTALAEFSSQQVAQNLH